MRLRVPTAVGLCWLIAVLAFADRLALPVLRPRWLHLGEAALNTPHQVLRGRPQGISAAMRPPSGSADYRITQN